MFGNYSHVRDLILTFRAIHVIKTGFGKCFSFIISNLFSRAVLIFHNSLTSVVSYRVRTSKISSTNAIQFRELTCL